MYIVLYNRRLLFSDRYGMIVSMVCSGMVSISISLNTLFLIPFTISFITFLNLVIGAGIGILFGSLVSSPSMLSGFSHGVMGALMGTMLGAVIQNPSLCSLPTAYLSSVQQNMMIVSIFLTILVCVTMLLIYYSLRV